VTGGDEGAGTINAQGLYINGVSVALKATNSSLGLAQCDGATITCTAGVITATGSSSATSIVAGVTTVGSCTNGYVLYDNAGVLGCGGNVTMPGTVNFTGTLEVNGVPGLIYNGSTVSSFGGNAGNTSETGAYNVGFGTAAGASLTSGVDNTLMGVNAGPSITSGSYNSAYGFNAGGGITTGIGNYLFGYGAGDAITTGSYNSIFGNYAGTATLANAVWLGDGQGYARFDYGVTTAGKNTITGALNVTGTLAIPQATWTDTQTCTAGQISVDASYVYVCTSSNTVKRAALSSF
jgi:hypothetical protein